MKRQRARVTRAERDVMRLRAEGREFTEDTMRRARVIAGDEMDRDIERQVTRAEIRQRLFGEGNDG